MKIESIEITHHSVPLVPPFHPTWDSRTRPSFGAVVVRVRSDDGHVGYGSGDAMPGFSGHEDLFIGQGPLDLARHYRIITNLSFHLGKHWPLDLALWDLAGKITGQPVWRMLGGASRSSMAYASLGQRRPLAELVEIAQRMAAEGFRAVKIRFVHDDWREDVAVVEAVRKAIGDKLDLMVDCNQAWRMQWDLRPYRDFGEALGIIRALSGLGVYWVEEPLFRGDYDGLRRLRDLALVRIAGGELTRECHEAAFMVEYGCFDVLQTDAALAGGISGLVPLAHLCARRGVFFSPHTWGNGLMIAAGVQVACGTVGTPYMEFPYDPPHFPLAARDFLLAQPFGIDGEGRIMLTDRPGLGVEIDEDRLAATLIG